MSTVHAYISLLDQTIDFTIPTIKSWVPLSEQLFQYKLKQLYIMKLFFIINPLTSTLFVLYYVLLTEKLRILFCRRDQRCAEHMCNRKQKFRNAHSFSYWQRTFPSIFFHIGRALCLVQVRARHSAEIGVVCLQWCAADSTLFSNICSGAPSRLPSWWCRHPSRHADNFTHRVTQYPRWSHGWLLTSYIFRAVFVDTERD